MLSRYLQTGTNRDFVCRVSHLFQEQPKTERAAEEGFFFLDFFFWTSMSFMYGWVWEPAFNVNVHVHVHVNVNANVTVEANGMQKPITLEEIRNQASMSGYIYLPS